MFATLAAIRRAGADGTTTSAILAALETKGRRVPAAIRALEATKLIRRIDREGIRRWVANRPSDLGLRAAMAHYRIEMHDHERGRRG